jgi:hypothetical protein
MAKILRTIAAGLITLVGIAVIAWIGSRATSNDYIEYWSSAKLFLAGANPYSAPSILALEKAHGFLLDSPLIMLNPPWSLFLVAPLGFLPELAGLCLWIVFGAGCVVTSLLLLDVPPKYRTLAFLFAPVIACFSMEQSSPFLLLGLSLFLRLYPKRPFVAGASLLLMTLKPHLFLVFWLILIADCLYRRRFAVLAGLATAMLCASALSTIMVPNIWLDYYQLLRSSALDHNYFPTLPTLLRMAIDVKLAWIALIPSCLAILWGLAWYWHRRKTWDWKREGMLVILVAVVTSPYGWASDQVVFLPAVAVAILLTRRRFSMEILAAINGFALVAFVLRLQLVVWIPMAWLAWYLYAVPSAVDRLPTEDARGSDSRNTLPNFSV